jgi:tetratricopeptide (TPR) repeat protein
MLVDFHLRIPALAMTLAVVAALALGPPEKDPAGPTPGSSRFARAGWLLAALTVTLAWLPILRFYRAEALRYRARETGNREVVARPADLSARLQRAEADLRRATSLAPRHAAAWSDLAHVLQLQAWADPAQVARVARPAVAAAQHATEIAPLVPEFWMRLGVGLDLQGRRAEAEQAFARALQLAPRSSNAWYYYAYHLSFDTDGREAALRAIATCLSLDPGNAAAEALRVTLNERPSGAPFIP